MVIIGYHINIFNYLTCSNEESEGEVNKLSLVLNKGPLIFTSGWNKSKFMNLQCSVQISYLCKHFCLGRKSLACSKYSARFVFPEYYMFGFCKAWIFTGSQPRHRILPD